MPNKFNRTAINRSAFAFWLKYNVFCVQSTISIVRNLFVFAIKLRERASSEESTVRYTRERLHGNKYYNRLSSFHQIVFFCFPIDHKFRWNGTETERTREKKNIHKHKTGANSKRTEIKAERKNENETTHISCCRMDLCVPLLNVHIRIDKWIEWWPTS